MVAKSLTPLDCGAAAAAAAAASADLCTRQHIQTSAKCVSDYSTAAAAAAATQVRKYIQTIAKPGISLTTLCETLENSVRNLIEARGLDAGDHQPESLVVLAV